MVSQCVAIAFHPLWCYIFLNYYDLGITGIGIAGIITDLSVFLYNVAYSYNLRAIRSALFWPDSRCFEGVKEYLRLGLYSAFALGLDCWANALATFSAKYVSVEV